MTGLAGQLSSAEAGAPEKARDTTGPTSRIMRTVMLAAKICRGLNRLLITISFLYIWS
jgi:hypothetical protein